MIRICAALALVLAQETPLRDDAAKALRKAVDYFRAQVAVQGGYVWRTSEDLSRREGEGKASATTVWVQPPGTPTIGLSYLAAYEATGAATYLEAARETAHALARGQLRSGGWMHRIEFDPKDRARTAYRADPEGPRLRNWSSLDDNTTQSALLFLARADKALGFKDERVRETAKYAFEAILKAQYPNGGFPQGYQGPAEGRPAIKAGYPESWPRQPPRNHDYWVFYTLNDNLLGDLVPVLLEAERIYGDKRFRDAALKVGDFLILAQMPEPQPAWAQQYDFEMHPTWARKFEPPAVTGGESQGAIETLLLLHRETGDRKYLEPVPRALEYLRRSRLPGGRLARFYELRTNTPLYFTKEYELTHRDDDLPTHYSFTVADRTEEIARDASAKPRTTAGLEARVRQAIAALDDRGRWVEEGSIKSDTWAGRILSSETFARNVELLSRYLAATKP